MTKLERLVLASVWFAGGAFIANHANNPMTLACGLVITVAGIYMLVRGFTAHQI